MISYIQFWLAQYAAQAIFVIGIFICVIALWAIFCGPSMLKQMICKHPRYRETRSCDAICTECGKNLGFIGNVRGRNRGAPD